MTAPTEAPKLSPGQSAIIERLRAGPLICKDPEGLASTPDSLNVQMHKLRALGFPVITECLDGSVWKRGGEPGRRGSTGGQYRLIEGESA